MNEPDNYYYTLTLETPVLEDGEHAFNQHDEILQSNYKAK